MMNIADYAFGYFEQDFPTELLCWMGYIFIPIITTMILGCSSFIYEIFSVPIYFWNLIWHPKSQSVIDILQNSEGNGRLIPYNNNIIATAGENELVLYQDGYGDENHAG